MLINGLIGAIMIALTMTIQAIGTMLWMRRVRSSVLDLDSRQQLYKSLQILIGTGLVLCLLHALQIISWAWAYAWVVAPDAFASMQEAIYFSFVTFTTLGYGDITLSGDRQVVSGIEALNGILLLGWSTALLVAILQRLWQNAGNS
jgi:hypothetical protein